MIDKRQILNCINATLNYWALNYDLFNGGCVYAAAVTAGILERYKIHYEIVGYVPEDTPNGTVLGKVVDDDILCHLAVEVDGKELGVEIRDEDIEENGLKKVVFKEVSGSLYEIYEDGEWDTDGEDRWTPDLNEEFKEDMEQVLTFIPVEEDR